MTCPNCHNEQSVTENNYGALYTCASCQAVYFINFDGKPEFGEMPLDQFEQASDATESPESLEPPASLDLAGLQTFDSVEATASGVTPNQVSDSENFLSDLNQPLDMSTLPPTNLPDVVATALDDLPPPNKVTTEIDSMQPLVQFNQNEFAAEPEIFQNLDFVQNFNPLQNLDAPSGVGRHSFSEVAKDISDYGNSESQIAHLNYDLKVSGLDTIEVINGLKEAIDDSRFGWDANEMMRQVKAGEVFFEKLNPVKAYILAKRLRLLNVEKVWKQNAVG